MDDPATPPAPQERFKYQPLDDTANSIRLLRIAPPQTDERIHVTMIHADMRVEYSCLSYMWGTGSEDHDIVINGCALRVRENLFRFLCVASHRFPDQLLWIDALCINQADNSEKGHQVERMGEIYHEAQETLIWLGEGPLENVFDGFKAHSIKTKVKPMISLRPISKVDKAVAHSHNRATLEWLLKHPYW
jgi:hypothetical protein